MSAHLPQRGSIQRIQFRNVFNPRWNIPITSFYYALKDELMLMRNSRTKFNSFKPTSKTLKIEESIKWHAMNRQKLIDVLVPPHAFEKFKNINFQTQRSVDLWHKTLRHQSWTQTWIRKLPYRCNFQKSERQQRVNIRRQLWHQSLISDEIGELQSHENSSWTTWSCRLCCNTQKTPIYS